MTFSETHRVLVKKQETRNQVDTYDEILVDKWLLKNMLNVIALQELRIVLCASSSNCIKRRVDATFLRERKVIKNEPEMYSSRSICFSQFFDYNVNHF
jgi:hypothetical protein